MTELLFATGNPHKAAEIASLLGEGYMLKSLADLNFTEEIPEDCDTLEGNALGKARFVYQRFHTPCFADDTGLEVQALNGAPGVYSARYAGADGPMSVKSEANIRKLLTELQGHPNRSARFRTVIAFVDGQQEWLFEGEVPGTIIQEKRGREGFGYDPIFLPLGFTSTFAEMPLEIKNTISHRARAFQKFLTFLNQR